MREHLDRSVMPTDGRKVVKAQGDVHMYENMFQSLGKIPALAASRMARPWLPAGIEAGVVTFYNAFRSYYIAISCPGIRVYI